MFHSARLKLTAWYLCVIMLISVTFSVAIYKVLTIEIGRFEKAQRFRIERSLHFTPRPVLTNPELIDETKHRILAVLFFLNGGIFVLSGALGYVLAGRTLAPIQQMVDEQNRFISDASHELKTPLTSLKSAFEVYLRNIKPTLSEAKTVMKESIMEVDKLQSLSESLLFLANHQIPNATAGRTTIKLSDVIDGAVRKMGPVAKRGSIILETHIPNIEIRANKHSLVDLIVIFVDNAIKYSNAQGKVTIRGTRRNGSVEIAVSDKGLGIADKDMPYIFDRFYRSDSARSKSKRAGYGLGLSIAKKIVDQLHGSIRVTSVINKGSTFIVQLPAGVS